MKYPLQILLFTTAFWNSCVRMEDKVTDDQLAIELLNSGQYHEAALVLEGQIAANPENSAARLRLASAYAGETGFNLIDAFSAFEPLLNHETIDSAKADSEAQHDNVSNQESEKKPTEENRNDDDARTQLKRFEGNLLTSVLDSEMILKVFFNLPYLSLQQRDRIRTAIQVLTLVPESYSQYNVSLIYQGVLHLLLFSNYTRDGFVGIVNAPEHESKVLSIYCGLDINKLLQSLPESINHLRASLSLISTAGSNQQSRFFENSKRALQSAQKVQKIYLENSAAFNLAEAGNRSYKESICDRR